MAGEIARALITALLFVAISGGFAFPRVLRQSVLEANQNPPDVIEYDYDQSSPEPDGTTPSVFLELSTATALPEEVKEDLNKLAVIVEKEERERGHHMTRSELQEVEKQLEEVPWRQRQKRPEGLPRLFY
ncbi:unnamed protein product [Allacma fusca]|uniref:Uncharacterized protein n=1 Tax=Allacma fusca TaxID=39272 RepID=A0A8J2J7Y1_9HEXA|nr:unnamed protein product [Allacma fusca]